MQYAEVLVSGVLELLVSSKDPGLKTEGEWGIINPLSQVGSQDFRLQAIPVDEERAFVSTGLLRLLVPEGISNEELGSLMEERLRFLRALSRNPRMAVRVVGTGLEPEIPSVPSPVFPVPVQGRRFVLLGRREKVASTMDTLLKAMVSTETPAVHADLALDSLAAVSSDPTKAILFAAMCVEVMARHMLDGAYQTALDADDNAEDWRIIERTASGGSQVKKDPVFESLWASSKRRFAALLHELPLYAWRRSLLQDDEDLYRRAQTLYATRNDIVHEGGGDPELLPLDIGGAQEATEIARGVFRWFGAEDYFVVLDPGPPRSG